MDTALPLTTDMKLVLGLVGFTMVMFLFERIRADVVALVVLVLLGLTGLVAPEDLFGGFSGNAVMSVIATMILGAGLDRTGALNRLAAWLLRRSKGVESRLLLLTSAVSMPGRYRLVVRCGRTGGPTRRGRVSGRGSRSAFAGATPAASRCRAVRRG